MKLRNVVSKKGQVLSIDEARRLGNRANRFAMEIAAALQRASVESGLQIKTVAGWTGANERTVKNWFSGLPEPLLLDAAHIVADKDERLGQPVVSNGIPLSKIHHAAFDAHLIGIDPDFRMHVSNRLLGQNDGPMLEALKQLNGRTIRLPDRVKDNPDRDRLAMRFERFKSVA